MAVLSDFCFTNLTSFFCLNFSNAPSANTVSSLSPCDRLMHEILLCIQLVAPWVTQKLAISHIYIREEQLRVHEIWSSLASCLLFWLMVTVADQKTLRKTYEATVQELFFTLFSTGHPSVIRQKYLS